MDYLEILGYAASGAVFITFWMKTMIPLRVIGICSNVLFFLYGLNGGLTPIVMLHGLLFPLNILRLYQAVRLRNRIHEIAHSDFNIASLVPFMEEHTYPEGHYLCRLGEETHDIYYLAEGRAHAVEIDVDIEPGHVVGEIAMFTPERQRTQSIVCIEECVVLSISEDKVLQIYTDNPEFGLFLIKMIVQRLLENMTTSAVDIGRERASEQKAVSDDRNQFSAAQAAARVAADL